MKMRILAFLIICTICTVSLFAEDINVESTTGGMENESWLSGLKSIIWTNGQLNWQGVLRIVGTVVGVIGTLLGVINVTKAIIRMFSKPKNTANAVAAAPKPAPKPAPRPAPKPTPRPAPKPAPKPAPNPVPKPVQKPVAKPAPKPAPRPVAKPVTKANPKPIDVQEPANIQWLFCPNCGAKIIAGSHFCEMCGKKID